MALFNTIFHEFFTDPFFRTSSTVSAASVAADIGNVRRVAHLMDSMVLNPVGCDSFAGFPHVRLSNQQSKTIRSKNLSDPSDQLFRRKSQAVHFLRRSGSRDESKSGPGSPSAEDEVWRKSLRRGSRPAGSSSSSTRSRNNNNSSTGSRIRSFVISPPPPLRRNIHNNNNAINNAKRGIGFNLPSLTSPSSSSDEPTRSAGKMIPPLLPATLGNKSQNGVQTNGNDVLRRRALAAQNGGGGGGSSGTSSSGSMSSLKSSPGATSQSRNPSSYKANGYKTSKSAAPPTLTERFNREQLISKITNQLACERYLVEMIEREVLQRKPNVEWSSIAGLKEAKALLQEVVVLPNIVPDFFKGIRRPWKGVLLVGPPGTGKTLLAKAVATECKSTFFNVTSSTLTSKFRGESEKLVRILFHMARCLAPSIIFIDEVDALVATPNAAHDHEASRRFQAELLIQMDGLHEEQGPSGPNAPEGSILVLAASNHPWRVDEAFRRRFEKRIYIPLPDGPAREDMLRLHLVGMKLDPRLNLAKTAKKLEGYSGADILSVCRDAAMMSLRRKIADKSTDQIRQLKKEDLEEPITAADFAEATKRCKSSVSAQDMAAYDAWMKEFGSY